MKFDSFIVEPLGQPFFQCRHRLGQCAGPVVPKHYHAVIKRPSHEAEAFLVADLDMALTFDPHGNGREHFLDANLFRRRLDLVGRSGLLQVPDELIVGIIYLGQIALDDNLDTDFFQMGKQFLSAWVASDVDAPGPVRSQGHWSPHGIGQELGEVIDGGRLLDLEHGKEVAMRRNEGQAEIMRG
jgi:hypothetical protein